MTVLDDFYDISTSPLGDGKPEEPRGQYDRYILPRGDGQAMEYTRTTTLVGSIDSGYGLGVWQKYRTVWGAAQRDDLIARLRAVPVDDKATIREVCDTAELIGGVEAAANDGTAAHAVLQRVDQGTPIEDIHPYYQPLVRNYQAELVAKGITVIPELIERTCRCARLDTAGKPDNVYRLADGSLVIGDKKTITDVARAERAIASQLAIYANCEHMWNYVTGQYEPMPPVRKDFALVVLIDTDTWAVTIETINIEYGWARTRLMVELRESNKVKGLRHPYLPEGRWDLKPKTVLPIENDLRYQTAEDNLAPPSVYAGPGSNGSPAVADDACPGCGTSKIINGRYRSDNDHPDYCTRKAPVAAGPVTNGHTPDPVRTAALANAVLDAAHQRVSVHHPDGAVAEHGTVTPDAVTVGPRSNTTPPPVPSDYPVVDPTARVQEILDVRKNDKARLQRWSADLGNTDLAHNRKWLAEWIVKATPDSGAIEPDSKINSSQNYGGETPQHPQTLVEAGLPPAPPEPPGVPVVQDNTPEMLTNIAAGAPSLEVLRQVWKTYTDTYGPDSWDSSGPVKAAADARADFLKRQLAGDDGPPF
jgi:hypothetical protein